MTNNSNNLKGTKMNITYEKISNTVDNLDDDQLNYISQLATLLHIDKIKTNRDYASGVIGGKIEILDKMTDTLIALQTADVEVDPIMLIETIIVGMEINISTAQEAFINNFTGQYL